MAELNADARRVRELCERMGALAVAGDPRWRRLLAKARRIADRIDEPFSRDDAASRLGLLASRAAIVDGDAAAAADHLRAALAAVDRQRGRVGADGQRRLDDHEWTMRFNLAQLRQALDELPAAERELARCDALAPSTDDPAARTRATLVQRAAGELGAQRLPEAIAAYGDAVARFRREAPAQLGVPLLGLAQARLLAGAFDEAEADLDRAEPLLGGDADAIAAVHQARAQIALLRGHGAEPAARRAAADRYRDATADPEVELDARHREQAALVDAHADHADGDPRAAKTRLDALVAEARAGGRPGLLADALARAATATQDVALTTADAVSAERLHRAALAQLTEARGLVAAADRPLRLASIDVALADFVAQWHPQVDGMTAQLLRAALERADAAAEVLRAASLAAGTAAERRDFAALHARHGFEVACDLAFRLGDSATLARLIDDRAAGYDWRAARA